MKILEKNQYYNKSKKLPRACYLVLIYNVR